MPDFVAFVCPYCHRTFPPQPVSLAVACPSCHQPLKPIARRAQWPNWFIRSRRAWRDRTARLAAVWRRDWMGPVTESRRIAEGVTLTSIGSVSAVAAIFLWNDSAGWLRYLAVGSVVAVVFSVCRLIQLRWEWFRSSARGWKFLAAVSLLAIFAYVDTARTVVEWDNYSRRESYWDTWTWTGNHVWREVLIKTDNGPIVESGPMSRNGKPHGAWTIQPSPDGPHHWFWYGQEVSATEWATRHRLLGDRTK